MTKALSIRRFDSFLRADAVQAGNWVLQRPSGLAALCVAVIVLGGGCYGAVMGCWSAPLQALYVAIKLPLVILLTTLGNALLNGMLAPLLGANLSLRQSLTLVLASFALASALLGALSPVALFVVWNTPPLRAGTWLSSPEYGVLQLTHTAFIALAGIIGNLHLVPLLRRFAHGVPPLGDPRVGSGRDLSEPPKGGTPYGGTPNLVARRVLVAWLAGNLFLGSQIAWVIRPFIWDPAHRAVFIGSEYFRGSFYETLFEASRRILSN